ASGALEHGLSPGGAGSADSLLTGGDGLASQIPALLVSAATGLVVTRAGSDSHLGSDIGRQLLSNSRALFIVSGVLVAFGFVPGLPLSPFLALAAIMGVTGYLVRERQRATAVEMAVAMESEQEEASQSV